MQPGPDHLDFTKFSSVNAIITVFTCYKNPIIRNLATELLHEDKITKYLCDQLKQCLKVDRARDKERVY